MKLINALNYAGQPFEIPDASRNDLPQFFVEMGYKVGAEIGVAKGKFSQKFLDAGLTLFAIDSWGVYSDYNDPQGQAKLDSEYNEAKQILESYKNAKIIRKTSMEAVNDFADESLDFVYIDANHEFRYIAEDLVEWTKKVRRGGIVSGHDYFFAGRGNNWEKWHVAHVLEAYTLAYNITNWYVIGRSTPEKNEVRDTWRSWLFVRP